MSKDELSLNRLQQELNDMKTNFDMIQGRSTGILQSGATIMLQKCADKIMILHSENEKLKKQLDDALKLIPRPKEPPKSETEIRRK